MRSLLPRKRPHKTAAFAVFLWLILIPCVSAGIGTPNDSPQDDQYGISGREDPQSVSWNIAALRVTYDNDKQLYIAEDQVVITGGVTRLEADYVEFSDATKEAFARGNVLLISGQDTVTCDAMRINLATRTGTIDKGTVFIQDGNFYISGDKLRKTGRFSYDAQKGTITTCDGDNPDWKITGKEIKVTVHGYGTARHTALWAKNLPVLYSPYLVFPVKTRRQTGLLAPRISSSDRKGWQIEQPLFIAISRNTDATIYADIMSKRGVRLTGEYRYVLSHESKGMMALDFLDDQKIDDGTSGSKDFGYASTPRRTNKDRYWFRMKHDQALPYDFFARLDLDIVSDADFLHEFKEGLIGYDATQTAFENQFGRSLDEYDDTTRKNSLMVSRNWAAHRLNIQTLWYDNVIARRQNTTDTTLQTLPSVEFDAIRQQIGGTGLYYSMDSEFRSFYRKDTSAALVNGRRADLYPKLYYPVRLGTPFFFEPYAGVRGSAWHTDDFTDLDGDDKDFRTRASYDLGARLSTKLERIFDLNAGFAEKIRHEIIPRIEYAFSPRVDQDDLPEFDDLDRLEETNRFTWSLTNSFMAKTIVKGADGSTRPEYRELAWIKLYQDYDIRRKRDDKNEDPWQDLNLEYELAPCHFLSSMGELAFTPDTGDFSQVKIGATLRDRRGDNIYTAYRYEQDITRNWYTRFLVQITDELAGYYSFEKDLDNDNRIEDRVGLLVTKPCWGLRVEYKDASDEQKLAFMITLTGIGAFGSK